ncbi:MAG: GH92 family glycosyl hydrolase, partial [Bacteroidales bacterium]|nr:GH92 family glycosyl hydrolase [Bacteroidales bacterium]
GHGHTFPGATVPFGMVQLSPDTRMEGWDACSGYHDSDRTIIGFSHTHLSGTGIGDYGDILFMPVSGRISLVRGDENVPGSGYRSAFSKDSEEGSPGYYSVKLDDYGINAELTATARAGFHRYTYPESEESGIIIDLDHTLQFHKNMVLKIKVLSDTEIEGLKVTQGWARYHPVYFYARFSKPFKCKIAVNDTIQDNIQEAEGQNIKAVLSFTTSDNEQILAKVGISSVDSEGARNNLETEIPDWDFEKVMNDARDTWNKELSKIKVEGGSEDQKTIFYTAVYHSFISPNVFSDADGRYFGMDHKTHQSDGSVNYTVFSLWDTFRAAHPLLTLVNPSRDAEMIRALLRKYDEGGLLPMWDLASNYTGTMIGSHAIPVIVDAYKKGIRDFDVEKAYRAMIKSADFDTANINTDSEGVLMSLMPMAKFYNKTIGFVPSDKDNQSVAKALELAYNDWCVAKMAEDLGRQEDFNLYSERASRYKKYFDPKTRFMRGIMSTGEWRTPFDPRFSDHSYADYVEGNAWQWTWFVPHDVPGLIDLMGGREKFTEKLDSLFSTDSEIVGENRSADISGLIGQYAHGNEPSHHITHFYNYAGEPWKTQKLVDQILNTLYFNNPDGLSGNEDCGQMSAWYVLNAIGFYQVAPGDTSWSLGRPLFGRVTVNLENGKTFTVETKNNSPENIYIQSAVMNGTELKSPFFDHEDIVNGGHLVITMGPEPSPFKDTESH